uniref:Coenzyme PQQ synthesis protein F-like C-terminal lobe domain-containing protein n=1 Tax=Labrus bergylta TaxID=56723 RepID=A0A3Q3EER4_9LABR
SYNFFPCFAQIRRQTLYQVYPTCRNTSGVLGFSVTVETQATKFSTEFVEAKIEEFLVSFGECLSGLSEEAFKTQVTALIKLKECEDAHLGEEVDRNWFEVVTQQYVFKRLNKEVRGTSIPRSVMTSYHTSHHRRVWKDHLSNHQLIGLFPDSPPSSSAYGEVSELNFLPASSPALQDVTLISDIRAFTSSLPLHPYHKILS